MTTHQGVRNTTLRLDKDNSLIAGVCAGVARYLRVDPTWVRVGDAPVRSREAAAYSLRWIDKLQQMADEWPGWRSQNEKDHVYRQFEEARQIYRCAQ